MKTFKIFVKLYLSMANEGYLKYIDLSYTPSEDDLVVLFKFKANKGVSEKEAAGAIAAESSTGTWTDLATMDPSRAASLGAKVFSFNKEYVKIAYPLNLFELGNMPQIYSSVCGNIFGMKEVASLRVEDIKWPLKLIKSFKGPKFGVQGVRKITKIKDRPLCGTIIKPKLGLNEKEHAKVAYEAWVGGIDIVKDDENLTSQSFNKFEKRARETIKMKEKAEKETGEKKIYMCNITAETNEMLKRAEYLKQMGNEYLMVDIHTVGWSALQTLRNYAGKLGLVMHGHRAMHAAFTRNKEHGINFMVIAETARLIGLDQLHIGTGVGKMEGSAEEIKNISKQIQLQLIEPDDKNNLLGNNWGDIKPVFSVSSGGLHPGHVPALINNLGKNIIIQAGGGVHGNPLGTSKGATAMRQAIDSVMNNIPLKEYARTHPELQAALSKWGEY